MPALLTLDHGVVSLAGSSSVYGAVHLVTTTFGQWLCSGQIVVENFFEFNTSQNSQIVLDNHHFCCLNTLISICTLHWMSCGLNMDHSALLHDS